MPWPLGMRHKSHGVYQQTCLNFRRTLGPSPRVSWVSGHFLTPAIGSGSTAPFSTRPQCCRTGPPEISRHDSAVATLTRTSRDFLAYRAQSAEPFPTQDQTPADPVQRIQWGVGPGPLTIDL